MFKNNKTKWYAKTKLSYKNIKLSKNNISNLKNKNNFEIKLNNNLTNKIILNNLYVPSNCLQGSELQIHLLWPNNEIVEIHIEIPANFKVIRLHNCEKYIKDDNSIIINKFEVNGYIGIVLKTDILNDFTKDENLKFIIYSKDGIQEEIRTVHLFRPCVKIISIPELIEIKKDDNGKPLIDPPIKIKNYGEGLALLSFDVLKDCEIKLGPPKNSDIFLLNFRNDFSNNLKDIKPLYPDYEYIFNRLFHIEDQLFNNYNEELLNELDDLGKEMKKVFENDKDFTQAWIDSITNAYIKNINKLVDAESFIAYMKSIEKNKILFLDSISVLKINKEKRRFVADLKIQDLGSHFYKPLQIKTYIYSDKDVDLSVYELLKILGSNEVIT